MKLAHRILASALLPAVFATSTGQAQQQLLAQWTFTASPTNLTDSSTYGPILADAGINGGNLTGFHASTGTDWTSAAGNPGNSLNSNNWAIGDYYQFQTSTLGYGVLSFTWDQYRSGTGPATFALAWSTDGQTFTTFASDYALTATTTWTPFSADLSAVTELANAANVYFRVLAAVAPGAAGGTSRIDNITINGVTIGAAFSQYWDPNGIAAGVGGTGTWSATSVTWNDVPAGTNAPAALDPTKKAVFEGIGGTVTIDAAVANAGIEVNSPGYTFADGVLTIGGTNPTIKVTNASDTLAVASTLSGTAGLRKTGAGGLALAGQNTLAGTINVQEGTLLISEDANLGDATNPIVLAGGALGTLGTMVIGATRTVSGTGAVDIPAGETLVFEGPVNLTGVTFPNAGEVVFANASSSLGNVTFAQATTASAPTGPVTLTGGITTTHTNDTMVISAPLAFGNAGRVFTVADGAAAVDLRLSGALTSSGVNGRLVKLGDGALEVPSAAPVAGVQLGSAGTTPAGGGRLIVREAAGLGTAEFRHNGGVLFLDSATPVVFPIGVSIGGGQLGDGAVFAGASMEFTGSSSLFRPANTSFQHKITAQTQVTFSGGLNAPITPGAGTSTGLTISGPGLVVLNNPVNSLSESISVENGRVLITGGITGGALIIAKTGGLVSAATNEEGGTSESLATVIVESGGTLSPSGLTDPTARVDLFGLTLQSAGTLAIQLGGTAATDYDHLAVAGSVELGGSLLLELTAGYEPVAGDTFTLILNDDAFGPDPVVGTFAGLDEGAEFAALGTAFQVSYAGGTGNDVTLTVIPEPGTGLLLLGGCAFMLRRRRR